MKILAKLLTVLLGFTIMGSCSEDSRFINDEADLAIFKKGHVKEVMITVPFNAKFTGEYLYQGPHPDHSECGIWDPENGEFWGLVINAGEGTSTHLGHLLITLNSAVTSRQEFILVREIMPAGILKQPTGINYLLCPPDR